VGLIMAHGTYYCKVHVPEALVGQMIGKKGANMKEINLKTGARCWVDNSKVIQGCKVLEITGNDEKSVSMAKQIIQSQLGQFKKQNSGAERVEIPGLGAKKERKRRKKNGKKNRNQKLFDSDDESVGLSDSNQSDEEETAATQKKQEKETNPRSNSSFENYWDNRKTASGNQREKDVTGTQKKETYGNKKENERKAQMEREWDLLEIDSWKRNNLWGRKESKSYSVGYSSLVCSETGRLDMQQGQKTAEIGTTFFKKFKEQLVSENYNSWKEQAGENWRNLMMCAHKEMEKNLCKAISHYSSGFHGAAAVGDVATVRSLARNLLVSYSYLAPRVKEFCRMDVYSQALDIFKRALEVGSGKGMDCSWIFGTEGRKGVVNFLMDMVDEVGILLPSLQYSMREVVQVSERFVGKLDRWTTVEEERVCLGHARLRQGESMFNMAAMAMGDKNYVDALYLFQELYSVVEESKRLLRFPSEADLEKCNFESGNGPLWRDLKLLVTDIRIHTALAEALKVLDDGDDTLNEAIEGYETLQLELVYIALDKYRLAVTLARGEDIEIMCIAYTKIARIYIDIFKDGIHKTKAKEYLNNVMELSKVMSRNLYTMDWYKDATKFLKDMQDEKQKQEDELWQNKRKVFMEQLSDEVKELVLHEGDTDRQFLVFLFAKFPPKHRQEVEWKHLVPEGEDDGLSMKKTMMKLVTIYHPDRVDKTVHSGKYHVLCEEITKELTNRYSRLKA